MSAASVLTALLQADLAIIESTIIYQDLYILGVSPPNLGGCNPWLIGIGSSLSARIVSERPTNISLITYDANTGSRILKTCDEAGASLIILKAVDAATTTATSTSCLGLGVSHIWISKRCGDGITALCVDCIDPCGINQCPSLNSLNPCGPNAYGCSGTDNSVNAYRVMTATFVPLSVAPSFKTIVVTPAKTSVSVVATLESATGGSVEGRVYCGRYASTIVPSSLGDIRDQIFSAKITSNVATVSVLGLIPSSNYDIYCFAESSLGTLSTMNLVLETKRAITTICCKSVNIIVSIQSLYVGSQSVNSIQVTLDALPSSSLKLTLGTLINGATSSLVPAFVEVQRTDYTFSISQASSNTAGVVSLIATLSGDSASEFNVVFVNRNDFTVIALSMPPAVPALTSVRFSGDGTYLSATFDADTNKASISLSSFACSDLFSFSGVAGATCSWESPSLIVINLGNVASIAVGGTVTLLGVSSSTFNITALCLNVLATPGTTACKDYGVISRTERIVLVPLDAVVPVVGISAPSGIGSCDQFTMDLSSSTGTGGRAFTSISFVVTASNATGAAKAQTFLNSQYVFSPPTALPFGSFPTGLNNIAVTMCNFLGSCGLNSHRITVQTRYVPTSLI